MSCINLWQGLSAHPAGSERVLMKTEQMFCDGLNPHAATLKKSVPERLYAQFHHLKALKYLTRYKVPTAVFLKHTHTHIVDIVSFSLLTFFLHVFK